MRLVIDTDVIVAAMRSPGGASAALLVLLLERQATMLLSVALAFEYEMTSHERNIFWRRRRARLT